MVNFVVFCIQGNGWEPIYLVLFQKIRYILQKNNLNLYRKKMLISILYYDVFMEHSINNVEVGLHVGIHLCVILYIDYVTIINDFFNSLYYVGMIEVDELHQGVCLICVLIVDVYDDILLI